MNMYAFFLGIHLITILLTIVMIIITASANVSKPQLSNLTFMIFILMFMVGFLIEITTNNLSAARAAIKFEYFANCGIIMGYTWFISEFGKIRISKWIYGFELLFSIMILTVIFSMEHNNLFYKSIHLDINREVSRIIVEPGMFFILFYIYFVVIFWSAIILCLIHYIKATGIEKKRIGFIITGSVCPWFFILLKASGLSKGYDLISFGLFCYMTCLFFVMTRYGYFNSIQAANENILKHGKEGILVIDNHHNILFANDRMKVLFPEISIANDAYDLNILKTIFEGDLNRLTLNEHLYDIRLEPLVECGYTQGQMLWVIDMTEHYKHLDHIKEMAATDGLTSLYNRTYYQTNLKKHLKNHGTGSMFMIDMDNFKTINDKYGHQTGDEVLRLFGEVVRESTNSHDLVCRLGGDEFSIFFMKDTEKTLLIKKASCIISNFHKKLVENQLPLITTVSIGIAVASGNETDFGTLYNNADKALYLSKQHGKNTYHFFES